MHAETDSGTYPHALNGRECGTAVGRQMQKHVLQWHITHRCNLHCTHCYQEDNAGELPFAALESFLHQYLDFCSACHFKGHINLTGGEPLISEHLFPLLDLLEAFRVTFGLLSNGTCITGETATPDVLDEIFARFCIGK